MQACEAEGCDSLGRWHVILDAKDGSDSWWACYHHATAFRAWVMNETNRHGDNWASVEIEYREA